MARYRLRELIFKGAFFDISEDALLVQTQDEFAPEFERLKNVKVAHSFSPIVTSIQSPSQLLYGKDYGEINRVLVGVLALRWINAGDYERLVGNEEEFVKLQPESFQWIQQVFTNGIKSHDDLYALVMSLLIDGQGKDPELARDYEKKTGKMFSGLNDDLILLRAVDAGMVHCLERLPAQHKEDLMLGFRIAVEFGFGQLAQAENVPACLEGLRDIRGHDRAFEWSFLGHILKIAGARGHEDHTYAKLLTEPVFQSHRMVYEVAKNIIASDGSLLEGYDVVLRKRAELLRSTGFRPLLVGRPAERALLRLLCMGRAFTKNKAELFVSAFQDLPAPIRGRLIEGLNRDGALGKPAVQPTYMPAVFALGLSNTPKACEKKRRWSFQRGASIERNAKVKALKSLLRYLARVLEVGVPPDGPITVIERNVREIEVMVQSSAFRKNPEMLDKQSVPKDGSAKLAGASQSR